MNNTPGSEVCQSVASLIELQLHALEASVSLLSHATSFGNSEPDLTVSFSTLKHKCRQHDTGSGGNIVADDSQGDVNPDIDARNEIPPSPQLGKNDYLRILISNALLVVRLFLIEHELGNMRTPEIQFLGHICDAILNKNIFDIDSSYIPIATFYGLTVDSELNEMPLFGDGVTEGFMEFGDAIALLQWLSHFFSGEKDFVTGGDAG